MATTPQQNYAQDSDRGAIGINPATAVNQGDLVKVVAGLATPITADTDQVYGVSADTNPVASLGDSLSQIVVIRRGVVRLFGLAGDTFTPNAKVWFVTDAQTVTSVDPGGSAKVAGRVREVSAVTAVAGTRVLIEPNYESIA
jgi:hypothetical protein